MKGRARAAKGCKAYERRFDHKGDNQDAKLASLAYLLGFRRAPGDPRLQADLERACLKRWGGTRTPF